MTLEEIKEYLKIDYNDEDTYLTQLIDISQYYIENCVGTDYQTDEKLTKLSGLVQKKLINDMYENRGSEIAANTKQDRIVTSIFDILSVAGDE